MDTSGGGIICIQCISRFISILFGQFTATELLRLGRGGRPVGLDPGDEGHLGLVHVLLVAQPGRPAAVLQGPAVTEGHVPRLGDLQQLLRPCAIKLFIATFPL